MVAALPSKSVDDHDVIDQGAPSKRSTADKLELAWIAGAVLYSVVRFAVAWGGFATHGANPWIFGIIDIGTAFPYAKATATLARRAAQPKTTNRPTIVTPLLIAIATFFAPYAYLWFAAGTMPAGLRLGMVMFVVTLFVAATIAVVVKSRKLRRELEDGPAMRATAVVADSDDGEGIIVDLTKPPAAPLIDVTQPEVAVDRSTAASQHIA